MIKKKIKFFKDIFRISKKYVKENKSNRINSIKFIKNDLSKNLDFQKDKFLKNFPHQNFSNTFKSKIVGMNSVGLLLDRLTILTIKLCVMENKKKITNSKIKKEIDDLIFALSKCGKLKGIDYRKITRQKVEVNVLNFREAYIELLISNFLLWEAQEVLYNRDILKINSNEIKNYISLFSLLNIKRNILITKTEEFY